jgi:hypothetical protein
MRGPVEVAPFGDLIREVAQHNGATLVDWMVEPPSEAWLEQERQLQALAP